MNQPSTRRRERFRPALRYRGGKAKDGARIIAGMAVVTGYDCELHRELYGDWRMERIATSGEAGKRTTECLWISPNAAGAHRQLGMIEEG